MRLKSLRGTLYQFRTPDLVYYIHFPNQRNTSCGADNPSFQRNQMTSSVDLFSLIMDLATTNSGNGQWRSQFPDQAHRESLYYYLYHPNATETLVLPNTGSMIDSFPYILSTTDEDFGVLGNPGPPPTGFTGPIHKHVACLRTKTPANGAGGTDSPPNPNVFGPTNAAKLATYNVWDASNPANEYPSNTQYEFYDYDNAQNSQEWGNNSNVGAPPTAITPASQPLLTAMVAALGSEYVTSPGGPVNSTGLFATELDAPLTGHAVIQSGTTWGLDPNTLLSTVQSTATAEYETYENP